jgi:hypothetical protein
MPNCGAKIGASDSSLIVRVEPSEVTPSPSSVAPVARKAAQPSVVPATIIVSRGSPKRAEALAEIGAATLPGCKASGRRRRLTPSWPSQSGQHRARGS